MQSQGEISEQECDILRFSMVARNALVDSTFGSPDAFTQGTVKEVLEAARATIRKGDLSELSAEKGRRSEAELKAAAIEESLKHTLAKQQHKIRAIAFTCGRTVRWVAYGLLTICAVGGFILTLPASSVPFAEVNYWIVPVLIGLFSFIAIWNLQEGGSIRALARTLEATTARLVETRLNDFFE